MKLFANRLPFPLLLAAFLYCAPMARAQEKTLDFDLSEVIVTARDVKMSAIWYKKYLDISIKKYKPQKKVVMKAGDFTLTLNQGNNVLLRSQLKLPKGKNQINGIEKIGFSTNKFDMVHERLKSSGQKLLEEVTFDKNLEMKYLIVTDPDGNKIQIFDRPNAADSVVTEAFFFSILSSDYINTMKWYEKNIDFSEIETVDESKIHYQNLLHKGRVIFEIVHLPYESLETTEFMPLGRELAGFDQIIFKSQEGKMSKFQMDNNANKVQWRR